MKKMFAIMIAFALAKTAAAQVPQLMNYQAVARNAQGQALANQNIKVRLSLNQVDVNGASTYYSETRAVTTNALGLFNVQVGSPGAQNVTGSIQNTNWLDGSRTRNLHVELDVNNSNSFIDMGSQQLVTVPYALAAREAESAKKITGPFIGFRADRITINQLITGNDYIFKFDHERYDSGQVYNPATGEFTVPEDGMYSMSFSVNIFGPNIPTGAPRGSVAFYRAGSVIEYLHVLNGVNAEAGLGVTSNMLYGNMVTFLKAGDKIQVKVVSIDAVNEWRFYGNGSSFQVYKLK